MPFRLAFDPDAAMIRREQRQYSRIVRNFLRDRTYGDFWVLAPEIRNEVADACLFRVEKALLRANMVIEKATKIDANITVRRLLFTIRFHEKKAIQAFNDLRIVNRETGETGRKAVEFIDLIQKMLILFGARPMSFSRPVVEETSSSEDDSVFDPLAAAGLSRPDDVLDY